MAPRQETSAGMSKYGSIQEIVPDTTNDDETVPLTNVRRKSFWDESLHIPKWAIAIVIVLIALIFRHTSSTTTNQSSSSWINCSNSLHVSPVDDLGFQSTLRQEDASPSSIWGKRTGPFPTNGWCLVCLLGIVCVPAHNNFAAHQLLTDYYFLIFSLCYRIWFLTASPCTRCLQAFACVSKDGQFCIVCARGEWHIKCLIAWSPPESSLWS